MYTYTFSFCYYLATSGVIVHRHYVEILYEGDTLVTYIYMKNHDREI